MATTSKSRRPVMATPPPKSRVQANIYTIEEKQQLLDNFDLEVEDKIRAFESHLALTLQSFVLRQDSELFRIPRELRSMTLRDIQANWGGSLGETVKKMKRDRIEQEERDRAEREEEERKAREKKRKLEEENSSPGRSKNARKEGKATSSTSKGVKRKPTTKKGKSAPSRTSTNQPSALPQNHIFNPLLPPTPKMPRAPRRGESFMSVNGSPLAQPQAEPEQDEDEGEGEGDDSEDDLPDPEAYEAKLTKSQKRPPTQKPKRGPSLLFARPDQGQGGTQEQREGEVGLSSISLKDGRVISFDPLNLSPRRIEDEMRESGMASSEREVVSAQIKDQVVKALSERMERWSGLS